MPEPSDPAGTSRSVEDAEFDRRAHPALGPFFAALDDLASPAADAGVGREHIARAAAVARSAASHPATWRTVGWRVAAVAAATAVVVGGLGSGDRLPAPAQRMVSSLAETFGIDLPDGSERGDDDAPSEPHRNPDSPRDGTFRGEDRRREDAPRATPAEPADPGEPGVPATPAVPAEPQQPERPETPSDSRPESPTPSTPPDRPTPADTAPSTTPPDQPTPTAAPRSNPNVPDRDDNADDGAASDGSGDSPSPRTGSGAAPDDADGGRISEKSPSNP